MKFPEPRLPQSFKGERALQERIAPPPSRTAVPFEVASVSATAATALTVPDGEVYQIDKTLIHNPNAGAHAVEVWIVPDGGTRGATNRVWTQTIAAGATADLELLEGLMLGEGEALDVQASAAVSDTLNLFVSCTRIQSGW